jgi:hypothetical protein
MQRSGTTPLMRQLAGGGAADGPLITPTQRAADKAMVHRMGQDEDTEEGEAEAEDRKDNCGDHACHKREPGVALCDLPIDRQATIALHDALNVRAWEVGRALLYVRASPTSARRWHTHAGATAVGLVQLSTMALRQCHPLDCWRVYLSAMAPCVLC